MISDPSGALIRGASEMIHVKADPLVMDHHIISNINCRPLRSKALSPSGQSKLTQLWQDRCEISHRPRPLPCPLG